MNSKDIDMQQAETKTSPILLLLAWGFVGIPLLAGVSQTLVNAMKLLTEPPIGAATELASPSVWRGVSTPPDQPHAGWSFFMQLDFCLEAGVSLVRLFLERDLCALRAGDGGKRAALAIAAILIIDPVVREDAGSGNAIACLQYANENPPRFDLCFRHRLADVGIVAGEFAADCIVVRCQAKGIAIVDVVIVVAVAATPHMLRRRPFAHGPIDRAVRLHPDRRTAAFGILRLAQRAAIGRTGRSLGPMHDDVVPEIGGGAIAPRHQPDHVQTGDVRCAAHAGHRFKGRRGLDRRNGLRRERHAPGHETDKHQDETSHPTPSGPSNLMESLTRAGAR